MTETLTKKGWPRPRGDWRDGARLPIPWIVEPPEWASMDPQRGARTLHYRLCQVCGEGHNPQGRCVIFLDGAIRDAHTRRELEHGTPFTDVDVVLKVRDQAMLHGRCAKLTVGNCPAMKRAKAKGDLFAFTVPLADLLIEGAWDTGDRTAVYARGDRARVWTPAPTSVPSAVAGT